MKKSLLLTVLIGLMIVVWAYSETVVYQQGVSAPAGGHSDVMYCYVYETDKDVNDFTTDEFVIGNAILDRIVIDANGTDTSFKMYLYDCATTYNDVTLWSDAAMTTASVPYSQALVMSDGTGNHPGIPVNGNLKITLADGDDATLANLQMYIYYRRR